MDYAEVAELVDALRSGRSRCMPVGVQIPPSAPNLVSWLVGYVTNKTLPFINTRIHDKIQKIYQKRLIPSLKKRGTYVKTPSN